MGLFFSALTNTPKSVFARDQFLVGPEGYESEGPIAEAARCFAVTHGLKDGDILEVTNKETDVTCLLEVFRPAKGRYPWHVYDPNASHSGWDIQ